MPPKPLPVLPGYRDSSAHVRQQNTGSFFQRKKVKPKVLMIFTRQLATLIDAGLPLLRGLNVLAKQERDTVLKNTVNKLATPQGDIIYFRGVCKEHPATSLQRSLRQYGEGHKSAACSN